LHLVGETFFDRLERLARRLGASSKLAHGDGQFLEADLELLLADPNLAGGEPEHLQVAGGHPQLLRGLAEAAGILERGRGGADQRLNAEPGGEPANQAPGETGHGFGHPADRPLKPGQAALKLTGALARLVDTGTISRSVEPEIDSNLGQNVLQRHMARFPS
jgi:hypothetical protein